MPHNTNKAAVTISMSVLKVNDILSNKMLVCSNFAWRWNVQEVLTDN